MNASVGDILNQGRYSIYVSNISEEGVLIQGNNLWVPRDGTTGDSLKYDNLARAMDVEIGGWSFGAQFGDLNNDGTLDLYLVNGYVSADRNQNYWYDFSKIAGGNSTIISDAAHWPAMDGRSLSGYQQKKVWLNDGAGKFVDVAQAVGASDVFDGRRWRWSISGIAACSMSWLQIKKGRCLIYKNNVTPENKWIILSSKAPRVIAARSERKCVCFGTVTSRCSRFRAAVAFVRRTSGACILAR
jgi:hypothetical protein